MRRQLRSWMEETHGTGVELCRHFVTAFFSGDTPTASGDWSRVGLGACALLPLTWPSMWLAWQLKYLALLKRPGPDLYRLAIRDDQLWLLAVAMCVTTALTAVQWNSLFPGQRDLLALASLPASPGQIFRAKFGALSLVFTGFVLALTVIPAFTFVVISEGRWQENPSALIKIAALAVSGVAACVFVFFGAVGIQGILFNVLPARLFSTVSVYVQALLFTVSIGALPFLSRQPAGARWWPPQWFLGLWAAMTGAPDGSPGRALAAALAAPAVAAVLYLLSYHRYPRLLLEQRRPAHGRLGDRRRKLSAWLLERWIGDPREQAMFVFIWNTLRRSRNHRLVLLAYIGVALGWLAEAFAGASPESYTFKAAAAFLAVLGPLAIAGFVVAGLRYLYSLPVELPANWIFQITEREGSVLWLGAVERFTIWFGIAPVFVLTLPLAASALGLGRAMAASCLAFLLVVLLFEVLFRGWAKAPFTCSYISGKRPMLVSVLPYFVGLLLLPAWSALFLYASREWTSFLALLTPEAVLWWWLRNSRMRIWAEMPILYEDDLDTITTLGIEIKYGSPEAAIAIEPAAPPVERGIVGSPNAPHYGWFDEQRAAPATSVSVWSTLDTVLGDIRYAGRLIRRNFLLSSVVAATLTLGIGLNVSIFTLINGLALRPRVNADARSFAQIYPRDIVHSRTRPASYSEYLAFRANLRSLSQLAGWYRTDAAIEAHDRSGASALLVTCNSFAVDGSERPLLGRLFAPEDCSVPGQARVAVLSETVWRERFRADPAIAGKVVHVNDQPFTVIGVAGAGAGAWIDPGGIWLPYTAQPQIEPNQDRFAQKDSLWLSLAGRLAPGYSRGAVQAELAVVAQKQDDGRLGQKTSIEVTDGSWIENPDSPVRGHWLLGLIMGAVTLVLLISCANVTTLLLAKASARQREIAVRLSLGAERSRILRMLLTESLILTMVAGAAGVFMALRLPETIFQFVVRKPAGFPLTPDWRVFGYISIIVVLTGLFSGLAPALESLKVNLVESLKGIGPGSSRGGSRLRGLLVSTQVALSLAMLVSAGIFIRAQYRMFRAEPGYETRKVVVAPIRFPPGMAPADSWALLRRITGRIERVPGVQRSTYAVNLPLIGRETVDASLAGQERTFPLDMNSASPGYFETLGIPIVRGRGFREQDVVIANRVFEDGRSRRPQAQTPIPLGVVITERFARRFWPDQDPIGRHLELAQGKLEVIGVVKDLNRLSFAGSENPVAYWLAKPGRASTFLLVRIAGQPQSAIDAIRAAIREVDSDLLVVPAPLQSWVDDAASKLWSIVAMIVTLGSVAMLLAVAGIYGAVSFAVSVKTKELGIRIALGAQRLDIVAEVLRSGGRPVFWGLLGGLWISLALAGALRSASRAIPFRIDTADPLIYLSACVVLIAGALLAMAGPARRGATTDPLESIRWE